MHARLVGILLATTLSIVGGTQGAEREGHPPSSSPIDQTDRSLVTALLKLLQAHSSSAVIREFINAWTSPYLTSIDDLQRLRQAGAGSDVLNAFGRRGAELRLHASRAREQTGGNTSNPPPVIILLIPVVRGISAGRGPVDAGPGIPPDLFSESLWWWGNFYPPLYRFY